jgi:hypothetical protein
MFRKWLSEQNAVNYMTMKVRLASLALALLVILSCAGPRQETQNTASPGQDAPAKQETNGIEVVRIQQAVNGLMLDLRYRVTDSEKARKLLLQTTQLSLVDQASGTVLPVPNMANIGKLRNIPNSDDTKKVYWIFFNNPGGMVKPGSKVTLTIGNVKIKDITVE